MHRFIGLSLTALVLWSSCPQAARAEPTGIWSLRIEWEARNRFRLFRSDADFQRHVAAARGEACVFVVSSDTGRVASSPASGSRMMPE